MSKNQDTYRKIFQASECPSIDDLFDYKEGKLNKTAMHSVEHHLAGCPLCSDALDGYQHISDRAVVKQQVVELGRRFAEKAPVAAGGFKWGTLAAASVVVLISWGAAYLFMKNNDVVSQEKNISSASPEKQEEKALDVNADSSPALTISPSGNSTFGATTITSDLTVVKDTAVLSGFSAQASSVSGEQNTPPAQEQTPIAINDEIAEGTYNNAITSPSYKSQVAERGANYNRSYDDVVAEDIAEKEEIAIQEQQQRELYADTTRIAVTSPTPTSPGSSYQSSAIGNNQKAGNAPQKKDKQAPAEKPKTNDVAITQAMQYYNSGNYELAASTCRKLLAENNDHQGARFYLGMSYRKLKQDDKAYPELSKIVSTNLYYEEARWNMAMIDISKGRYETARKLLNEIVAIGKKYKEQAATKLKEIEGK